MQTQVRQARKEDAQQMLNLYTAFAREFLGPASRDLKTFKRILKRKERICWIALNKQGKMIGYVSSRFESKRREGRIEEIVVEPNHNSEKIAKHLVDTAYKALVEKKPAMISAGTFGDPQHERIFPAIGFQAIETTDVFMYAILNTQKFLNELAPILAERLNNLKGWNGLTQVECEEHSIFLQKTSGKVEPLVWTNQPVDFKVTLTREILTKLVFGVGDSRESLRTGQLKVKTTLSQVETTRMLRALFPKKQFLIMDHW